jgi:hypothetical protein
LLHATPPPNLGLSPGRVFVVKSTSKKGSQKSSEKRRSRPVQKKRPATKNLSQLIRENETLRRQLAEAQLRQNATDKELREGQEQQTGQAKFFG